MKKAKWLSILLGITLVTTSLPVHAGTQESDTLVLGMKQIPFHLDAKKATSNTELTVMANIFEGLTKLDQAQKPTPGLAESWEISSDGLTYTFHLRDAKWSDGSPVSATDFEYGWKRFLDPKDPAPFSFVLDDVKGAKAYSSNQSTWQEVGIKSKDLKTFQVTLERPTSHFPSIASAPFLAPVKQQFAENLGDQYGALADKVLFNGPFKVAQWGESGMILEKNPDYYNASNILVQRVEVKNILNDHAGEERFNQGELDLVPYSGQQTGTYWNDPALSMLYLNTKQAPLNNKKIRQALGLVIDRQSHGWEANGLVPYGIRGEQTDFRKEAGAVLQEISTERAKQLLQDGLREMGLVELPPITMITNDSQIRLRMINEIADEWENKLGIVVKRESVPWKIFLSRIDSWDYQIAMSGWIADYDSPITFFEPLAKTNWVNQEFDELLWKARYETSTSKQMEMYRAAEKIAIDAMPMIPLYFYKSNYLAKSYVKGINYHPVYSYLDFRNTTVTGAPLLRKFTDTSEIPEYAFDAILKMLDQKVLNGNENNQLLPNGNVTREQFIKMFAVLLGLPEAKDVNLPFKDVQPGDWSYGYIQSAYKAGIIEGEKIEGNVYFHPRSELTRAEMAAMIVKSLKLSAQSGTTSPFTDLEGHWAKGYIETAYSYKLVNGMDADSYAPQGKATRAQAAVILSRVADYLASK